MEKKKFLSKLVVLGGAVALLCACNPEKKETPKTDVSALNKQENVVASLSSNAQVADLSAAELSATGEKSTNATGATAPIEQKSALSDNATGDDSVNLGVEEVEGDTGAMDESVPSDEQPMTMPMPIEGGETAPAQQQQ